MDGRKRGEELELKTQVKRDVVSKLLPGKCYLKEKQTNKQAKKPKEEFSRQRD